MNQQKHNPDYKLISVTLDDKEFVYGEQNYTGTNPGLEIYYHRPDNVLLHHYSRRYKPNTVPCVYQSILRKLRKAASLCRPGHKLTLSLNEYQQLS